MFRATRLVLLVGGSVTAALLLPATAVPESRLGTGAPNAALSATAHVNFKVIIPKVFYLRVGNANDRALGAGKVAVMSNSHNAQDAQCTVGPGGAAAARNESRGANAGARQVVCTLSMP
jgi:hypothetical protein